MLPKDEQNSGLIHEPNYVAAKNSLQIKAKAWENTAASKGSKPQKQLDGRVSGEHARHIISFTLKTKTLSPAV